jgi:hypothetical protein
MSIKLTTINPATIIAQWTGLRSLTLSGPREDLIAHAIIEAAKLPMLESLSIAHKTYEQERTKQKKHCSLVIDKNVTMRNSLLWI